MLCDSFENRAGGSSRVRPTLFEIVVNIIVPEGRVREPAPQVRPRRDGRGFVECVLGLVPGLRSMEIPTAF